MDAQPESPKAVEHLQKRMCMTMTSIRKVLAATDFSEQARLAMGRAALISQEHSAQLELLHVIEEFPPPGPVSADQAMDEARRKLEDEAAALSLGVDCDCQVATGKNHVSIIHRAQEVKADLVVVGAHGQHTLRDNFFGTTAEKLVRKAAIPVLIVKRPARSSYRLALVPTDFSEPSRRALSLATILMPGSAIDLLHIYGLWGEEQLSMGHATEEAREQHRLRTELWAISSMDEWCKGIDLSGNEVEEHVRKGYASSGIVQFAAQRRPDLVVMGTASLSGHRNALLGSVTEHVLRTVPCDVLVVRPGD